MTPNVSQTDSIAEPKKHVAILKQNVWSWYIINTIES